MSKSKGNVIDPLYLMDKYGADAVRFTLASLAAPGRDVKLGESRVEGYRNFMTKLWNAARFLEMNECKYNADFDATNVTHPLNQWIVGETAKLAHSVYTHLETYRFDLAAHAIYQFLWGTFCDVYVECLKPQLSDPSVTRETQSTAAWVLVEFLKISHPFIPLITEKLWEEFYPKAPTALALTSWFAGRKQDTLTATKNVETCLLLIQEVRSLRGLLGVQPALRVPVSVVSGHDLFSTHKGWMAHLGRLGDEVLKPSEHQDGVIPVITADMTLNLHLGDVIDMKDAYALLNQKAQTLEKEMEHLAKKLQNDAYKNAKPEQWGEDQKLHAQKHKEHEKIRDLLPRS
jgi:valyl-tRNA synthetase